jgi:hypothetical protein
VNQTSPSVWPFEVIGPEGDVPPPEG